jgi:hypothetical protein
MWSTRSRRGSSDDDVDADDEKTEDIRSLHYGC